MALDARRRVGGFTLVEMLIVVLVVALIGAIAVPCLLRSRINANESSAVGSLRSIHAGQTAYSSTCTEGGYAQSLDDLAKLPPGASQPFVVPPLTTNGAISNGYVANVMAANGSVPLTPPAATCNGSAAPAMSSYVAEEHPVTIGWTGVRSFATTDNGVIYFRNDGVAVAPDLGGATVMP
jgi:prepilin-type N-terminal cleavage/methylation domain-containing protein